MSDAYLPNLVKVTEIFLIPSSFLVAALGTADTNLHRAGVSLIGLVVSVMWWFCSREALDEAESDPLRARSHPRRILIMSWLPIFFAGCWLICLLAHLWLWNQPLGKV